MARQSGMIIAGVISGGIAHQMGIEPGDRIIMINDRPVKDIIDYRFLTCDQKLAVLLIKRNGERWILDIEKEFEEDLGVDFWQDGLGRIRRCRNSCIFCFLAQMPGGMRKTLYFNDDDYRLSFIHGNFITLTNVSRQDLERIVTQRLAPLYISVHTTNPILREKMLNNRQAERIMEQLSFLARGNIQIHTQVVLCPEINDGPELERTISDLYSLWPAVRSLALVPVGLTRYRESLFPLRAFNREEARKVLTLVEKRQNMYRRQSGYPFVFASDEIYFLAGVPVPDQEHYGDFPQTENGVGLVRLFLDEWMEVAESLPEGIDSPRKVIIVTGVSGERVLSPVVERLNRVRNLKAMLCGIVNRFWGEKVTVAGLLTAGDLYDALVGSDLGDLVVIPSVMLKSADLVFLDDLRVSELSHRLGVPVAVVNGPRELAAVVLSKKKVPMGDKEILCQSQL
jgi:putative radical SAM enzyme (TIGR03279 family)